MTIVIEKKNHPGAVKAVAREEPTLVDHLHACQVVQHRFSLFGVHQSTPTKVLAPESAESHCNVRRRLGAGRVLADGRGDGGTQLTGA